MPRLRAHDPSCPLTLGQLKKLSESELDRLFADAPPGAIPVGATRGQLLILTDAFGPRLKVRFANFVWKGKRFEDDGEFVNQWLGFQALRGRAELGPSWFDDRPCIVVEYPPNTPLASRGRDELREVAPGLYLGRLYELRPRWRFRGYFVIQACAQP